MPDSDNEPSSTDRALTVQEDSRAQRRRSRQNSYTKDGNLAVDTNAGAYDSRRRDSTSSNGGRKSPVTIHSGPSSPREPPSPTGSATSQNEPVTIITSHKRSPRNSVSGASSAEYRQAEVKSVSPLPSPRPTDHTEQGEEASSFFFTVTTDDKSADK